MAMSVRKAIINGQEIELEMRYCLNKRCDCIFWTNKKSKQGICSITCWEIVNNNRMMNKNKKRLPFYPDTDYKKEKEMAEAKERRLKYKDRIDKAIKKTLKG